MATERVRLSNEIRALEDDADLSRAAEDRWRTLLNDRDILDVDVRTGFPPGISDNGGFEPGDFRGYLRERAGASGDPQAFDGMSPEQQSRYIRDLRPEYEQERAQEAARRDGQRRLSGVHGQVLGEGLAQSTVPWMGPSVRPSASGHGACGGPCGGVIAQRSNGGWEMVDAAKPPRRVGRNDATAPQPPARFTSNEPAVPPGYERVNEPGSPGSRVWVGQYSVLKQVEDPHRTAEVHNRVAGAVDSVPPVRVVEYQGSLFLEQPRVSGASFAELDPQARARAAGEVRAHLDRAEAALGLRTTTRVTNDPLDWGRSMTPATRSEGGVTYMVDRYNPANNFFFHPDGRVRAFYDPVAALPGGTGAWNSGPLRFGQ